eukprot:1060644-Amphidinium_carterae.1
MLESDGQSLGVVSAAKDMHATCGITCPTLLALPYQVVIFRLPACRRAEVRWIRSPSKPHGLHRHSPNASRDRSRDIGGCQQSLSFISSQWLLNTCANAFAGIVAICRSQCHADGSRCAVVRGTQSVQAAEGQ